MSKWVWAAWGGLVLTFVGTCLLWKTFHSCKDDQETAHEEYFLAHLWLAANVFCMIAIYVRKPTFLLVAFGCFTANMSGSDMDFLGLRYTLADLDYYGTLIDHPPIISGFGTCEDYLVWGASLGYVGSLLSIIATSVLLSYKWEMPDFDVRTARKVVKVLFFVMQGLFWLGGFFLIYSMPRFTIIGGRITVDDDFYLRHFLVCALSYLIPCYFLFHMAYLSFSATLYVGSALLSTLSLVTIFSDYVWMKDTINSSPSFEVNLGFVLTWLSLFVIAILSAVFQKEDDMTTQRYEPGERSPFVRSNPFTSASEV